MSEQMDWFWVNYLLWPLGWLLFCCLTALFPNQMREVLGSVVQLVVVPADNARRALASAWSRSIAWVITLGRRVMEQEEGNPLANAISGLLFSVVTLFLWATDMCLIAATVGVLGIGNSETSLPPESNYILAMAITCSGLFWGSVLMACAGFRFFGPFGRFSEKPWRQNPMVWLSLCCLALTSCIPMILGATRADMMIEVAKLQSQQIALSPAVSTPTAGGGELQGVGTVRLEGDGLNTDTGAPSVPATISSSVKILMVLIPALSIVTLTYSLIGLKLIAGYVALLGMFAVLVLLLPPLRFLSYGVVQAGNLFYNLLLRVLELFIAVGTYLLSSFGWQGPPAPPRADADQRNQKERAGAPDSPLGTSEASSRDPSSASAYQSAESPNSQAGSAVGASRAGSHTTSHGTSTSAPETEEAGATATPTMEAPDQEPQLAPQLEIRRPETGFNPFG